MCRVSSVVRGFAQGGTIEVDAFADELMAMSEPDRVATIRKLTKKDMVALWEACLVRAVDAGDFVPADVAPGVEVIHEGKNSLPAFSQFQKRFCVAQGRPGVVYGYNHNWHNFSTTGPGYFVGRAHAERGEFGLNYYEIPPEDAGLPDTWPKIRKNEIGLTRFIYSKMIDYMRRIAPGVTIGRAWKHGKVTDNYFVLVRTA